MIVASRVSKRFGVVRAVDGVDLVVRPGERVAFVGSNGSGKTTLLRCVLGMLRFEGAITIDGVDVAARPHEALRRVAYVPQVAPPIDAPVAEVVRAVAALRGVDPRAVHARAARVGFDVVAAARKRFRDLSGGTKQKLLAALALAADAPILVCDEPTANLDGDARAAFFADVEARPSDAVLVLCSHRVEEVRAMVDRVVELKDGRVLRDGPSMRDAPRLRVAR